MTVAIHQGWELATNAVLEALFTHFDAELASLWSVGVDSKDGLGLFLPGVEGDIRLEVSPEVRDLEKLRRPVLMCGPAGQLEPSDNYFITGQAEAYTARLPFAAAVYFPHAPQGAVRDPVTNRKLTDREIMLRRALRYQGALAHTLHKHIIRGENVAHVEPVDSATAGNIDLPNLKNPIGSALYFFNIQQEQATPAPA